MIACLTATFAWAGVVAADHRGQPEGDGIGWTSTLRVVGRDVVQFAVPLPREQMRGIGTAEAVWDGDLLVGIRPRADGVLVVETFQPDRDGARPALVLDRAAPQQVSLETLRFEADPALGVTDRVGWSGVAEVGRAERSAAFRHLGRAWKHRHGATIVIADRPVERLAGLIEPSGRVSFVVVGAAVAAALGLLGALVGAHRLLDALARRERIDAWFAEAHARPPEPEPEPAASPEL